MGLSHHISIVPVIMMVVSLQVWLPLGCVEEERTALLQLKDSLNYPNGTSLPSWRKGDARCCDWERVVCSSSTSRVTELDLYRVRNGELGDWYLNASLFLPFQELISLDLWDNQIAGWVENKDVYQPFKMSKLEHLYLGYNHLDNNILSYIDGLSSLKTLDIGYNRVEGLIDLKEYSSNLEALDLSGNNITKVIASGGPTNVSTLYLNNIKSYGSSFQTLLQSLGAFPNLTKLDLGNNDLRGRILELRNLSSLEELNLDGCSLDENSFQSLGALPSLKNLSLQTLSGVVPFQGFLNLKNLELLDLSYNTLNSINIFQTIGMMTSLKTLRLQRCSLNGQLPTSQDFLNLKNLELLDLSDNTLNSTNIFQTIRTMTSLKTLRLQRCSLNGQLPTSQGFLNLKNLELLDISGSTLNSSNIFQTIIMMISLKTLRLQGCSLNGQLPTSQGEISPQIVYLSKIKVLNLSHNSLIGSIPPTFSRLKEIESLDLSYNRLEGEIPPQLTGIYSLAVFSVAHNNLSGKTPARVAQFATFKESSYKDNPFLCGQPLTKACDADMPSSPTSTNNKDEGGFMDMEVFYMSFGVAYIMVLLVIGAVLYINPYWRRAWFHFIEGSITNCYYFMVDNLPIRSKF